MSFIIAEVGSNFTSLKDCYDSISMAKQLGADAVKFQLYSPQELYGQNLFELLSGFELNPEWLPSLRIKADACGIELMCTAFSPRGVETVDPFVKRHKVASSEISHARLLTKIRESGKPVILSTGGASLADTALALDVLGRNQVSLLYCRANYPARNIDLRGITKLREAFGLPVGYSCHSACWTTPLLASRYYGASVVEKHFKIREMNTPDNPHSLLPEDFLKMVKGIRDYEAQHVAMPDPSETHMMLFHKRRLIMTKDVLAGEPLAMDENYGIYRSLVEDSRGLSGFAWEAVNGKILAKDMKAGDALGPGDYLC
jgi:sialic acid synthase SpsE